MKAYLTKTEITLRRINQHKPTTARLDRLASELVRKRGIARHHGCECCALMTIPGVTRIIPIRTWKDLQWAHFKSRNNHSVRWDESDAAGLCDLCHKYLDRHPKEKAAFFLLLLGQAEFDRITIRAGVVLRSSEIDYRLVGVYLREGIKDIEKGAQICR